ncbi:MAG: biopolymer transporter ExbD [Planctomycetota bacterium]|jgi:biopolymer transport protein ExbD|nr:MAG: biopolymer transporter ExbD [Planctomycetota bacterium]
MSVEDDDEPYVRKKQPEPDTEIDITPMIDVTFQLLIFFMVTSTMQGNPPAEIPKSSSGGSIETAKVILIVIKAPVSATVDPVIEIDKKPTTLEELRARIGDAAGASTQGIDVMIMADRTVPNRFTGEVESLIGEIEGVTYHFAVQDRR